MHSKRNSQLVYSSGPGRTCPKCGWPLATCRCAAVAAAPPADQPIPAKVVAKLRLEKAGRGGKTVTVVYDLPRNGPFLEALAGELKKFCGAGGTVTETSVEIQGDHREKLRTRLESKGWQVKG